MSLSGDWFRPAKQLRSATGKAFLKPLIFAVVFVIFLTLYLVIPPVPVLMKESLLILAMITAVHLVDRLMLWNSFTGLVEQTAKAVENHISELAGSAHAAGLKRVYKDRKEAAKDVLVSIADAKDTVWLLGIAFCEEPNLEDLVAGLRRCSAKNIKLLLLDPLSSPGLYRALLETPRNTLKEIFHKFNKTPPDTEPLLARDLYSDCLTAITILGRTENRFLEPSVKYYAHNPACWMVIADSTAYFQPYTFGQPVRHAPKDTRFGPYMPVFAFTAGSVAGTFEVFHDHFWKLWLTSDCGRFHFHDRWEHRSDIVAGIVRRRRGWFKHVYDGLCYAASDPNAKLKEQRKWPRQKCGSEVVVQLGEVDATVVDSSFGNLGLRLSDSDKRKPTLTESAALSVKDWPADKVTRSMLERFVAMEFVVARVSGNIVGLNVAQPAASEY